jgi:hypothetical protein
MMNHALFASNLESSFTAEDGQTRLGTFYVLASEASGEERDRLFRTQAERVPQFAEYEQKAGRAIP